MKKKDARRENSYVDSRADVLDDGCLEGNRNEVTPWTEYPFLVNTAKTAYETNQLIEK